MSLGQKKKKRKCNGCQKYKEPKGSNNVIAWCSDRCQTVIIRRALRKSKIQNEKVFREIKTRVRGSDRSRAIANTQKAFNSLIRALDAGEPCISCGQFECGHRMTCGHYKSVGSGKGISIRFDPRNAYLQGSACNQGEAKYGGARARTVGQKYTERLIAKMGQDMVDWLEGPHPIAKYDILWLTSVRTLFLNEVSVLEAGGEPTRDWRALGGHSDLQPPTN